MRLPPLVGKTRSEKNKEAALASQLKREEKEKNEAAKRFATVGIRRILSYFKLRTRNSIRHHVGLSVRPSCC